MSKQLSKFSHALITGLSILFSSGFSHADDTEIFFGAPSANEITPNVLFILDNSGSMKNNVVSQTSYDPLVDYMQKARDNGYSPYSDSYIWIFDSRGRYRGRALTSQNHCQYMRDKFASAGIYTASQVASFYQNRWKSIFSEYNGYEDNILECEDDGGVHGRNGSTGSTYARNHSSMWTGNRNQEISWGGFRNYEYWSANYLNWYILFREVTTQRRIDVMKDVVTGLINSTSGMNIGLMSFNTNNSGTQGGRVTTPIGYIEDVRSDFLTDLNSLNPDTWTPLSETLFEAQRYYTGGSVFLGSQSVTASKVAGTNRYRSPINSECQPNNIVLLTDGEPTYDAHLSGSYYNSTDDAASRSVIQGTVGNCSGNCLDEVARYMHDNDMSSTYDKKQNINTFTIGFNIDDPLLKLTAEGNGDHEGGGGKYFVANDTVQLESALKEIFSAIKETSTTFVTPGVAVNTFNRLNHRDELYFSVFKPSSGPLWTGNLKRYRLGSDGNVYDKVGNLAIDPESGFFQGTTEKHPGAISWWSDNIDADDIRLGGAAENLPEADQHRRVYTHTGTTSSLAAASNLISDSNSSITKEMLDIAGATDAERTQLLNWIRGMDAADEDGDGSKTNARHHMMDPLHSPPVVVIYGGSDSAPDTTIFVGDNQGFVHAINGSESTNTSYPYGGGQEYFAFMPDELLANQKTLFDNSQADPHPYGMDGAISTWVHDENSDNDLYDAEDFVYIYAGMRRGGRNYYALDVTDRNAPEFAWEIIGGPGGTAGYEEMGQSWAKPVKTKVKMGSNTREEIGRAHV